MTKTKAFLTRRSAERIANQIRKEYKSEMGRLWDSIRKKHKLSEDQMIEAYESGDESKAGKEYEDKGTVIQYSIERKFEKRYNLIYAAIDADEISIDVRVCANKHDKTNDDSPVTFNLQDDGLLIEE